MIIKSQENAKQLVCFDGLYLTGRTGRKNVWPTDIDGFIQLDAENLFIFLELKYKGDMKTGQSTALTRLADAIGENSYVLLAVHDTQAPKPVLAKDAEVKRIYRGSMGWIEGHSVSVKRTVEHIVEARKEVLEAWRA